MKTGYQKIKDKLQTMAGEATASKLNSLGAVETALKTQRYNIARDHIDRVISKDREIELLKTIYKIVEEQENENK